jgi:hypothetical protein
MPDIGFVDESGDKNHFTIIPNYIANHSTAIDQALYFQMKKHAGEKGECFASEKTLMSKMSIGRKALKKSITYLLGHKWITLKGMKLISTKGGEQLIKVYSINDIWKLNSDFYHKGVAERTGVSERAVGGSQKNIKGVAERAPNKNPMNKNQEEDIAASPPVPFLLKEEIEKLYNNPRREMSVIALYLEEKKPDIQNKGQLSTAIKRHIRPAIDLTPFSDEQILAAVPKAKKLTSEWTIETLIKVLTK